MLKVREVRDPSENLQESINEPSGIHPETIRD